MVHHNVDGGYGCSSKIILVGFGQSEQEIGENAHPAEKEIEEDEEKYCRLKFIFHRDVKKHSPSLLDVLRCLVADNFSLDLRRLFIDLSLLEGILQMFEHERVDAGLHGKAEYFCI